MAVLGPPTRVELAASRYTMSGDADRLSFDLIIQVFEFYRNSSSEEVLNRLVMESRIQHPRVDDAADFPSSDFRSGLRDSLIERAGSLLGDAERVLNEITDFTREISDYEDYESGLLIESVIFIAHKYVTLAKQVFRERKSALMAANNAVDDLIELKLHKECKSCSKNFHSDDKVILMPCSRKHLLHPGCAEKWCYQCPKCTFPFPNPSIDEGGDSNFDGGFGPSDDGSSSNGLGVQL